MLALILPFGPHAPLLLVLALAFLPVQAALAWAVRQGRPVAPLTVLVAPTLLLAAGGVGAGAALDAAWEAVRNSAGALDDPAWIPWVALVGRARALGPVALGAALAAVLAALPLGGALLRRGKAVVPGAEGEPSATPPPPAGGGRRGTSVLVVGLLAVGGASAGVVAGAGALAGVPGLGGLLVLGGACAGAGLLAAGAAWRVAGARADNRGTTARPPAAAQGRAAPTVGDAPPDDDLDLDEESTGATPVGALPRTGTDEVDVVDEEATVSMRASAVAALDAEEVTAPRVQVEARSRAIAGGAAAHGYGTPSRQAVATHSAPHAPAVPASSPSTAPQVGADRYAGEALRRAPPPPQETGTTETHLVAACAVLLVTALALATVAAAGIPVPEALAIAARGEAAPAGGAALHADYLLRVTTTCWFAAAAAGGFAVCAVPALVRGGGVRGAGNLAMTGLATMAALAPVVSARLEAEALAVHAGAQAVAVYEAAQAWMGAAPDVGGAPREGDPLPPRVLVARPEAPRWLNLRARGGLESLPVVPGDGVDESTLVFGGAGRSLGHGDGLLLPPELSAVDLYLLLADTRATEVSVVTCGALPVAGRRLAEDPLLATGVCGPVRLHLRRPPGTRKAPAYIVLKDREVDADGEIVAVSTLRDVHGPVVVRLQSDATVADLSALLARLGDAGPIVLGWGVDLDGGDIPVGVRP